MSYYTMNKNLRDTIMNPEGMDEILKEFMDIQIQHKKDRDRMKYQEMINNVIMYIDSVNYEKALKYIDNEIIDIKNLDNKNQYTKESLHILKQKKKEIKKDCN